MIRDTAAGVMLDVRVIPRSSRTRIDGMRDGALLVRIAAPPVDSAANDALIDLLATVLGVGRRAISVAAGQTARTKRVAITGLTADAVRARLTLHLPPADTRRSPR